MTVYGLCWASKATRFGSATTTTTSTSRISTFKIANKDSNEVAIASASGPAASAPRSRSRACRSTVVIHGQRTFPARCTGSSLLINNLVHTRCGFRALAFSAPIWTTGYLNSITGVQKARAASDGTQAALLSTRTRENWHPSAETKKSLTGSGDFLASN